MVGEVLGKRVLNAVACNHSEVLPDLAPPVEELFRV